ncbi:hypothetical protein DICPUDRAFT_154383 [Dictyostelium purpureum]|uniref:RNA helicase n=1 Tax=Dictyostelium purpureum TaxID=5786 RepID=F0ZR76_DICPU|nr:uncharacterized protein DICPUDRAFT_154383 [Dictyostelium purpureum]EGC33549.1 hypothetical protein DICPUDRAFT_154383 [Dictyostelium purpureum]|eukprot:XP_003289931.1 hypothetical protein DICPUDRAFT_154383 [Dictyostelium purpureum]
MEGEKFFESLGLAPWLIRSCKQLNFKNPSNIQYNTIPEIINGRDIIASAKTGSGKTASFAIPILNLLSEDPYGVFAVVLTPTRELAVQIAEQFSAIGAPMNVQVSTVIGGIDTVKQALILDKRPHIIVATPGRLASHLTNGLKIALKFCKFLVLDEADRLLGEDFELEIASILEYLPPPTQRQTLLFSATMTNNLKKLESISLNSPFIFEDNSKYDTVDTLKQEYIYMPAQAKDCYLVYLLKKHIGQSVIVFINNCYSVEAVKGMLNKLDIPAVSLHSFLDQKARLSALKVFKSGKVKVLIATDVASRGLDIPDVEMVINYKLSNSSKDYIHRVGRTARFGKSGRAISFITPHDVQLIKNIELVIKKELELYKTDDDEVFRHLKESSTARKIVEVHLDEIEFGVKQKERRAERNELQKQIKDDQELNNNNKNNDKKENENSSIKNNKKNTKEKVIEKEKKPESSKVNEKNNIKKRKEVENTNNSNNNNEDDGISLFKKKKK